MKVMLEPWSTYPTYPIYTATYQELLEHMNDCQEPWHLVGFREDAVN